MTKRRGVLAFLAKLAAFLLLVAAVDQVLARVLDWGRPADLKTYIESRKEYGDGDGYDTLILGSSHAADSLVPDILEASLGIHAFNFAITLATPSEWYFLSRDLIGRGDVPRLVIIGIDPSMFARSIASTSMTPDLIRDPWLRLLLVSESSVDNGIAVLFESGRKRAQLLGVLRKIIGQPFGPPHRNVVGVDDGYLKNIRNAADPSEDEAALLDRTLALRNSTEQRDYLEATIRAFEEAGSRVVLVEPPIEIERFRSIASSQAFQEMEVWLGEIARSFNVPLMHSYDPIYLATYSKADFLNATHVCFTGAWHFTRDVATWLATEFPELTLTPVDATPPMTCRP